MQCTSSRFNGIVQKEYRARHIKDAALFIHNKKRTSDGQTKCNNMMLMEMNAFEFCCAVEMGSY